MQSRRTVFAASLIGAFPASVCLATKASADAVSTKTLYAESNGRKLAYRKVGTGKSLVLLNRFR